MPRLEDKFEKKFITAIQKDRRFRCFKTKSESSDLPIGHHDLMIMNIQKGILYYVELKRDTYQARPQQLQWHKIWEKNTNRKVHVVFESQSKEWINNLIRGDYD